MVREHGSRGRGQGEMFGQNYIKYRRIINEYLIEELLL
jgi:hypothetical protein